MSLFDFFFPEQAQAAHLRALVDANRQQARRARSAAAAANRNQSDVAKELETLRGDVGYLTLLLASLAHRLDQKGVVTRADLRAACEELDAFDSLKDGKLDVQVIKDALRQAGS